MIFYNLKKRSSIIWDSFCKAHQHCIQEAPVFWLGLHFLIGCSAYFADTLFLFLLVPLLWTPYLKAKWSLKNTIIPVLGLAFTAILGYLHGTALYPDIGKIQTPIYGEGIFSISSLSSSSSSFQEGYYYRGCFRFFITTDHTYRKIPCILYLSGKERSHPPANQDYWIRGTLTPKSKFLMVFAPEKKLPWKPLKDSWSIEERRFQWKKAIKHYLHERIPDSKTAIFLYALFVGETEDAFLKFSFGQAGLQHITAVSGFNFSLLILFFSFFLRRMLPSSYVVWILLFLVNGYFFLLGNNPSIQRAWISIQIALFALLLGKRHFPLNALGCSLLASLLWNPWNVVHVGFQLSFLSTASLLIVYPSINRLVSHCLKKRSPKEFAPLGPFSRYGYLILSVFREAFSLSLAVNLSILPVVLFHFHWFPLASFLYNLFFPLLVILSLFLLLLGFVLQLFLPFLATWIHACNGIVTQHFLQLVLYPASLLHQSLSAPFLPFFVVIIYLGLFYGMAIPFRYHNREPIPDALKYC